MQRGNTISWLEILIMDLALILAIGAMGARRTPVEAPGTATAAAPIVQPNAVAASP
jgi:hypothetical protein